MALFKGGRIFFQAIIKMTTNAASSTKNVPLGMRKMDSAIIGDDLLSLVGEIRCESPEGSTPRANYCF